ncbi:glycosyl transferase group 1 [Leptolyngbya valderiana BDU 20041]|nr:glycosyl transferase group 1 [Leptolyngbya valderiana BDU 20041]PPT07962.1 Glycosyltransferase [Geitlerinema sp. FC II]
MKDKPKTPVAPPHVFVFLEIFACEGGIQSYVKDVLDAYQQAVSVSNSSQFPQADVYLLRDPVDCDNPFDPRKHRDAPNVFRFHYCQSNWAWLGRLRLAWALLVRCVRDRPDWLVCGHIKLAPLTEFLGRWLDIPYTVMTYGKEVWQPLPPRDRRSLRHAKSIWTIGRYSRDRACESNHLDPDKFEMLPCAVDGEVFSPAPKPQHLLDRYNLHGSRVLMTVARLWSGDIYKGVDVTIRALPKILEVCPDVKYLVIGRGDDKPRLENLTRELGVSDRVVFAGFVPTEELPDHYRAADAYIMPSQEGFGIVYLEAMATGIPVLSGDSDGSADPLQDGRLGWQVPHRDPEAVAQACIEILKGGDRRCNGEWLRQETLATFSSQVLAKRLREILPRS